MVCCLRVVWKTYMNERIRELAVQAEGTKKHVPAVWQFYDHELERFAELIVRECATAIINDCRLNDVRSAANGCVRTIKEHFGFK